MIEIVKKFEDEKKRKRFLENRGGSRSPGVKEERNRNVHPENTGRNSVYLYLKKSRSGYEQCPQGAGRGARILFYRRTTTKAEKKNTTYWKVSRWIRDDEMGGVKRK